MYLLCIYSYMHMAGSSTWGVCVAPWQVAVQYIGSPALAGARTGRQQCTHSARTVHAQCTLTVHGLEMLQIAQKKASRHQNKEKAGFMIFYLIACHFNSLRAIYTISGARTVACTAACTARALSKHTHLRTILSPLFSFFVLLYTASALNLASLCARSWNTLVSLGALPLLAPWQACVPAVGTLL